MVFGHDIGVARLSMQLSLSRPTLPLSSASSSTRLLFDNLVLAFPASTERREGGKLREEPSGGLEGDRRGGRTKEAAAARHLIDKAKVRRSAAAAAAAAESGYFRRANLHTAVRPSAWLLG